MLAGVGVRVGVNAARLAYPAPSGVVNYRLRQAGPVDELRLGAGFRDFGTRVVQADGSFRHGDVGFAGGFVVPPLASRAGQEGWSVNFGGVGRLGHRARPTAPRLRIAEPAPLRRRLRDRADRGGRAAGRPDTPPVFAELGRLKAVSTNLGVLYDGRVGGFTVDLAAFRSMFDIDSADFTLISADAAGHATATNFRTHGPHQAFGLRRGARGPRVRGGRSQPPGHRVAARPRARPRSSPPRLALPLGAFDLPDEDPPDVPEPTWSGTRGEDTVEQVTASAGYGLAWRDRVELRLGAHRTRYDKAVLSIAGHPNRAVSETTLYNASAIVSLTERTAVFGSWVTGLEESGAAPASATNRDEVLPPVEAEQFELGVRHELTAGTDRHRRGVRRLQADQRLPIRTDRSGWWAEVRHRGAEGSIAGQVDARTTRRRRRGRLRFGW